MIGCTSVALLGASAVVGVQSARASLPELRAKHAARVARAIARASVEPEGETPGAPSSASTPESAPAPAPAHARAALPASRPAAVIVGDPTDADAIAAAPMPPSLDDLFPGVGGAASAGPDRANTRLCYDRLQGVGGLSPCPRATEGALR